MKNEEQRIKNKKGFGLIEVVIVCGIIVMTFLVFTRAEVLAIRLLRAEQENMEAALLASEGLEAVRSIRDESWASNISGLDDTGATSYYPVIVNGKWQLASAVQPQIDGRYTRFVKVNRVYRDAQDKIAASGTLDASTKKITTQVQWGNGKNISLVSYLTDFQASLGMATETKQVFYESAPTESNLANFPSGDASGDPVQSFTSPASAIKVSRIDLLIRRDPATSPSDIYVEIRKTATGTVLGASSQITGVTIATTTAAWVEFRFQNAVSLNANTLYFIRLAAKPSATAAGSGGSGLIYWKYSSSNPYAGGDVRRYVGSISNPDGVPLSAYDFGFRIYSIP